MAMTMTSIERFEHYTIILPKQGRKLGLILSPTEKNDPKASTTKPPCHPAVSETPSKPQSSNDDGTAVSTGGDNCDKETTKNEPNETPEKRRPRPYSNNDGENCSASKKRRTRCSVEMRKYVFVRAESPALELADEIRAMVDSQIVSNGGTDLDDDDTTNNDFSVKQRPSIEWNSLDDLINFAMKKLRKEERYNREILKFALVNGIKGGDMLYCVLSPTKSIYATDMKPEPIKILSDVFSNKANYPLHVTFKRKVVETADDGSAVKQYNSQAPVESTTANEVICLLDSDSEPDEPHSNGKSVESFDTQSPPLNENLQPQSIIPHAFPDPSAKFRHDDLVQTPTGPGKIYCFRIDRYAQNDHSLVNPILMYTIQHRTYRSHIPSTDILPYETHPDARKHILSYHGVSINKRDFLRLWPQTFINDSLINFYIKYLQHSKAHPFKNDFHFFPTYFYTRMSGSAYKDTLEERRKMWNELKGWTKGVNIFNKKFLIFPINYDLHWTMIVVCYPGLWSDSDKKVETDSKKVDCVCVDDDSHGDNCHEGGTETGKMMTLEEMSAHESEMVKTAPSEDRYPEATEFYVCSETPNKFKMSDDVNIRRNPKSQTLNHSSLVEVDGMTPLKFFSPSLSKTPVEIRTEEQASKNPIPVSIDISGDESPQKMDLVDNDTVTRINTMGKQDLIGSPMTQIMPYLKYMEKNGLISIPPKNVIDEHDPINIYSPKACSSLTNTNFTSFVNIDETSTHHKSCSMSQPDDSRSINKRELCEYKMIRSIDAHENDDSTNRTAYSASTQIEQSISQRSHTHASQENGQSREPSPMLIDTPSQKQIENLSSHSDSLKKDNSHPIQSITYSNSRPQSLPLDDSPSTKRRVISALDMSPPDFLTLEELDNKKLTPCALDSNKNGLTLNNGKNNSQVVVVDRSRTRPCILHLDSGKHLKLHKLGIISKMIRRYLMACWEATRPESPREFNSKTIPGFSPSVPQQDNLKDCGVFMLEMMERLWDEPFEIDAYLDGHGDFFFTRDWFSRQVVVDKRQTMQGLIYNLQRMKLE